MSDPPRKRSTFFRNLLFNGGWALRQVLKEGYTRRDFRAYLLAGMTTGIIALPLSMALAIASGVPPQNGLYTAIVAGGLVSLLGGSRHSVTGPTAAFVVILAPVSAQYGLGGLMIATLMAGIFLVAMGIAHFGKFIQFIPYPVTTGFTAGIAVVIATLQVKDFLGLRFDVTPEHFVDKLAVIYTSMPTWQWEALLIGMITLVVLLAWPKIVRSVPAPLVATLLAAVAAYGLARWLEGFWVETIGSRFSYFVGGEERPGIPPIPPVFALPWNQPGVGGLPIGMSWQLLRDLSGPAFAIAMLGAIESLLCAVVADGMAGTRHDPDTELVAQGLGNIAAPFLGGIAATAAIARTAANIRAGSRSPLASFIHAIFLLLSVLMLAPLLAYLPMATMAALLLVVAWRMSDVKHFFHILKVAPKSDVLVLLVCFGLTVIFDMVIAVGVGVVLAALLFMQRMSEMTTTRMLTEEHTRHVGPTPPGVLVYEIAGSLFFGATERAMSSLRDFSSASKPKSVILVMNNVPIMDVTGLVALESVIKRMRSLRIMVILSGVQGQPAALIAKAGIRNEPGKVAICYDLEQAMMLATL